MSTDKMPPHEMQMEWIRFLETNPSMAAVATWCTLKAAEIGWDFFDLSEALSAIMKPQLPAESPTEAN